MENPYLSWFSYPSKWWQERPKITNPQGSPRSNNQPTNSSIFTPKSWTRTGNRSNIAVAGKWILNEDVFPIKHGDIPGSYVSLPEATHSRLENGGPGLSRCMDPIEDGDVIPASHVIVEPRGYIQFFITYLEPN